MRGIVILLTVCSALLSGIPLFAADTAKSDQFVTCPGTVNVEVEIKATTAIGGWAAIPAKSTFSLSIKEGVVKNTSMICHYTNGTVDYNLAKPFPKGKVCFLAPGQSFT